MDQDQLLRAVQSLVGDWEGFHAERAGLGRIILHRMSGPWVYEGEETFKELDGMKQWVRIGPFTDFGTSLVIDGMSQLPGGVLEGVYTSALIFPAALTAPSIERWLIAGGGDGPAAREALSFGPTKSVRLVDISPSVIAMTRLLMPEFWSGAHIDPRLTIERRDVFGVMREMVASGEKVNVVVSDLVDPADETYTPFTAGQSSGDHLYTPDAIRLFADCLTDDGVFVIQAQECSLVYSQGHRRLLRLIETVFPSVFSYRIFIEFFGYWEGFIVASKDPTWSPFRMRKPAQDVDQGLDLWYRGRLREHYSGAVHSSLFALPPLLENRLRL